ncbi:hypothetical protein D3C78_827640 [compost metagenome]
MPKNSSDTPHSTPRPSTATITQPPVLAGRMPATGKVAMKKLAANTSRLFGRRIHGPLDRRDGGLSRRLKTKMAPVNMITVATSKA